MSTSILIFGFCLAEIFQIKEREEVLEEFLTGESKEGLGEVIYQECLLEEKETKVK